MPKVKVDTAQPRSCSLAEGLLMGVIGLVVIGGLPNYAS